jgi:hypothetical protein
MTAWAAAATEVLVDVIALTVGLGVALHGAIAPGTGTISRG